MARFAGGGPILALTTISPTLMFHSHTASALAVGLAMNKAAKINDAHCECFVLLFMMASLGLAP